MIWQDKATTKDKQAALLELEDCQNELNRIEFWQLVKFWRAIKRQNLAIKNLLLVYAFDIQAARADRALDDWSTDRVKDFI